MASVIKMLAKRQHYEVWTESYECATMPQKLYTGKDHIDWKILTPPFLPVMTTGKSCFQVIESPCLNVSSQMCTVLSLPLPPQPFRLECAVTKRNITFWHPNPKTNGSWSRGIRYHHWYDSFEHTLKDMNEPGMGPEIIQAASKNPRLRNVKNRYSKVPLIHACEIGVSVRCLHGIWHLAFAKIPWLWPKISSVSRNIWRKSEERVSTKGHQVLISQKYLIAEGRPESEVRSLRRSNGLAKETKLCFAVMGTNIARNSSAIEQTATEYKCPALLPSFSYNYLTSTTTSSEQINIASALTTFNQQLMQQTGSSNSGSSLLWLQKLPSHLLAVAHTSIKVVSQQPFRLPFLTPLLQLQLKFCPTWHSGWLPNRYETCFFTNKVKKCYGCTLEFPDKYPRSHSESIRCFLNSNQ